MSAAAAEITLFWLAVFLYATAFILGLFGFVRDRPRGSQWAIRILPLGLLMHTAAGVVRWVATAHPPVTDTFELNLLGAWVAMLLFVVLERFRLVPRLVHLVVTPVVFIVLGLGYMARTESGSMGPAYDSPWLVLHVLFAWLAFACFLIAAGAAALLLLKQRCPDHPRLARIPDPTELDLTGYRYIVLGFVHHAVMLIAGAIWAKNLWGAYWSWDPLETWSLITFLFYAFYLHARAFLNWKMERSAWMILLGLLLVAVSFWGVQLLSPSAHPGI